MKNLFYRLFLLSCDCINDPFFLQHFYFIIYCCIKKDPIWVRTAKKRCLFLQLLGAFMAIIKNKNMSGEINETHPKSPKMIIKKKMSKKNAQNSPCKKMLIHPLVCSFCVRSERQTHCILYTFPLLIDSEILIKNVR